MVRDDRWKLIEYHVGDTRHSQLFDLANDPDELHNLADVEAHREVLQRLRAQLRRLGREFDDPVRSFYLTETSGR
jgi:arylsulfatase A-like enzyme